MLAHVEHSRPSYVETIVFRVVILTSFVQALEMQENDARLGARVKLTREHSSQYSQYQPRLGTVHRSEEDHLALSDGSTACHARKCAMRYWIVLFYIVQVDKRLPTNYT